MEEKAEIVWGNRHLIISAAGKTVLAEQAAAQNAQRSQLARCRKSFPNTYHISRCVGLMRTKALYFRMVEQQGMEVFEFDWRRLWLYLIRFHILFPSVFTSRNLQKIQKKKI